VANTKRGIHLIRQALVVFATLMIASCSTGHNAKSSAGAGADASTIKVLSQNLYIGVDISRLLTSTDASATMAELITEAQAIDFSARANRFAELVSADPPDVIGLQEVTQMTVTTGIGGGKTIALGQDYLKGVLDALKARGFSYKPYEGNKANFNIPGADGTHVDVTLGNALLVREELEASGVTVHEYGDKFSKVIGADPGIEIIFARGFVGVDVTVNGQSYRVVDTHLEVAWEEGSPIPAAQATELVQQLQTETKPLILLGDFNAKPGDAPYQILVDGGFKDTWQMSHPTENAEGYTCCHSPGLNDATAVFEQRIDYVFVREPVSSGGLRVTDAQVVRVGTEAQPWASDHAGLQATITWQGSSEARVLQRGDEADPESQALPYSPETLQALLNGSSEASACLLRTYAAMYALDALGVGDRSVVVCGEQGKQVLISTAELTYRSENFADLGDGLQSIGDNIDYGGLTLNQTSSYPAIEDDVKRSTQLYVFNVGNINVRMTYQDGETFDGTYGQSLEDRKLEWRRYTTLAPTQIDFVSAAAWVLAQAQTAERGIDPSLWDQAARDAIKAGQLTLPGSDSYANFDGAFSALLPQHAIAYYSHASMPWGSISQPFSVAFAAFGENGECDILQNGSRTSVGWPTSTEIESHIGEKESVGDLLDEILGGD